MTLPARIGRKVPWGRKPIIVQIVGFSEHKLFIQRCIIPRRIGLEGKLELRINRYKRDDPPHHSHSKLGVFPAMYRCL